MVGGRTTLGEFPMSSLRDSKHYSGTIIDCKIHRNMICVCVCEGGGGQCNVRYFAPREVILFWRLTVYWDYSDEIIVIGPLYNMRCCVHVLLILCPALVYVKINALHMMELGNTVTPVLKTIHI